MGKKSMSGITDRIFNNLRSLFRRKRHFQDAFVYLDEAQVKYFYAELTGLQKVPKAKVESTGDKYQIKLVVASTEFDSKKDNLYDIPTSSVYASIKPMLRRKLQRASTRTDIDNFHNSFCWLEGGCLRRTNFPDGEESLEIFFDDTHGLLLINEEYVTSIFKPYLQSKNMSDLPVESLVYVHSRVKAHSFNHPVYGDNNTHYWVPLSAVSLLVVRRAKV